MIKDNLTGIIISALLHAALFSWAYAVKNEPINPHSSNDIILTVNLFQEKLTTPPTPINPEFADLTPPPQELAPAPLAKPKQALEVSPKTKPIKVAEYQPEVIPPKQVEPKIASESAKAKPTKAEKPKVIKKLITKKKPITKHKKKIVKRKIVKKVVKKAIARKVVKKKRPHKVVKKTRIVKRTSKKAIAKVQRRPQAVRRPVKKPPALPVKRAVKQVVANQKYKKVGGMYSKNPQKQRQKQTLRAKPVNQVAKRNASQQPRTLGRSPANNSAVNAKLTQQYKVRLQQLIASKKRYPKRAKRRGQQGRVTISFRIRHSGIISDIRIIKGSKNRSLNEASIKAIKLASGKLTYPKGMSKKSLTLTITLSYILS